jgi:hypothetical protein
LGFSIDENSTVQVSGGGYVERMNGFFSLRVRKEKGGGFFLVEGKACGVELQGARAEGKLLGEDAGLDMERAVTAVSESFERRIEVRHKENRSAGASRGIGEKKPGRFRTDVA